ncbi:MAG: sugar porter family MFS transporter [Bacteroidota bacterium]
MNKRNVFLWSVTVAIGGFLFGFDTAVISGAEQAIQELWGLSDAVHGFAVATALYGTVFGAMFGGRIADRQGRKKTLIGVALLYLVSALGSGLAPELYSFMFFRFIGGLGVGASSVVAPMYISEIAPPDRRGRLAAMFQLNLVTGILLAYFSNYLLQDAGENGWRWMLGIESVPALAFAILLFQVPRSPRWLLLQGDNGMMEEAREVLGLINPDTVETELQTIQADIASKPQKVSLGQFFSRTFRFPIMLAFLVAFFNQVTGINAIIYYAPRIFQMVGLEASGAFLSTAGVGLVNLLFTLVGLYLIDRAGRRVLLIIGSVGMMITLGLVSRAFFTEQFSGVPIFIFAFIAAFAMSQGAIIWVYLAEIFPNHVRGYGNSLGSFTHWLLAAIVANIFPPLASSLGGGAVFAFFASMMVLQLVFSVFMMPETKGKSLEELAKTLTN